MSAVPDHLNTEAVFAIILRFRIKIEFLLFTFLLPLKNPLRQKCLIIKNDVWGLNTQFVIKRLSQCPLMPWKKKQKNAKKLF